MIRRLTVIAAALVLTCTGVSSAASSWFVDVEAAMVQSTSNDVRIPGDIGTEFSLTDDLSTDDDVAFRMRLGRRLTPRSHLTLLYAPLKLYASGQADRAIEFNGDTFAAGVDLEGVYKFNSYRATWSYDLAQNENLVFSLGVTGKIRDASIELGDGNTVSRKENLGFVPLVNFKLDWRWGSALGLLVEGDALAVPGAPGRAEDVLAALVLKPRSRSSLRLGYRILEGGADVDEVYNFALIQYYTFGWSLRF